MVVLLGTLIISAGSSFATWFILSKKEGKQTSWQKDLGLSEEQKEKFAKMESELTQTLKEIELEDAQNKIFLCSYLDKPEASEKDLKAAAGKMAEAYRKKQERIAATFASISGFLTPEQKKTFSHKLMREVCESCRNAKSAEKCICGMCGA